MAFRALLWMIMITLVSIKRADDTSDPPKGFGRFFVMIKSFEKCNVSGPIHEGLFNTFEVRAKPVSNYHQDLEGYMIVGEDYELTKASYLSEMWKNGAYKTLFGKSVSNPCHEDYMKIILRNTFKTEADCIIKKSNYSAADSNPDAIAHKLFGNHFFYNRVRSRIEYYSPKGATFCLETTTESIPLPKN